MTLVKFSDVLVGITCHHVVKRYRDFKADDPATIFQIGRMPFDPIRHLIAEDIKRDPCYLQPDFIRQRR